MAQTSLLPPPSQQFSDANGTPLSGGKVFFYEPGTTTAKSVYSNSSGNVSLPNPVILDSAGRGSIWLSGYYKVVLKDSSDNLIYTIDNVSGQFNQTLVLNQWDTQTDVLTYISATRFSVPGDLTGTYQVGRRIQAMVSAGTLTGTITASASSGDPIITTVTVLWDSGSMDVGLSSVNLAILTTTDPSLPIYIVEEKTANYTFTPADVGKTFSANSANAITFSLLAATGVASGSWIRIVNANTGLLTLNKVISGVTNPILGQYEDALIFSDGADWYSKLSKSTFSTHSEANIAFGSTAYLTLSGILNANAGEFPTQMISPAAGILRNLYAKARVNNISATSTVTLRKNGASQSLVASIGSNSTVVSSDTANTVAVAKGDLLNYIVATGSGSGNMSDLTVGIELDIV